MSSVLRRLRGNRVGLNQVPWPRLAGGWLAPVALVHVSSGSASTPPPGVYWYVEHATNIATIPLAVAGFGFTLWQIRKARNAAEAARDASREAQRGIGRSTLLLLVPQLQRTEEELERAIGNKQQDLVVSWLTIWRWQAGQLRGLLKVAAPTERDIMKAIQKSMVASAELKTDLVGIKSNDLAVATKEVRIAIAAVTNGLGELSMVQGLQIGQIIDA